MLSNHSSKKTYQKSIESLLNEFNTSVNGLSQSEAEHRVYLYGYNQLNTDIKIHKLLLFITQFKSFIIYILLFAVSLSLLTGEYLDATIISAILIANALIGYFQELSAHKSLEVLKKYNRIHAMVKRDGKFITIDAKFLVQGDIIYVSAGDFVPADCRLLDSDQLKVQEAVLTGESVAVSKAPGVLRNTCQIGDQSNMLFSSTSVIDGIATAMVVKTGESTEMGLVTQLIRETDEELTPLQKKLDVFGKKLSLAIIGVCLFIFAIIAANEYWHDGLNLMSLRDIALISVALAVAAVPEGLPAVVTITLSIGVKKLLKKRIIVKRLSSVETLGSCDVICTDKTGTLTRNEMKVTHAWNLDGESLISGEGYEPVGEQSFQLAPLIYEIGMLCNKSSVYQEQGKWLITGDPTEAALMVSAMKIIDTPAVDILEVLPFDSTRKKMSVLVKRATEYFVYTKGAPDPILESCTHVSLHNKIIPITDSLRTTIRSQINHYASQALRVIAMAYKQTQSDEKISEDGLVFVGLQAMIDPPREDVIESIRKTKEAGVRVIMITGDYKETAMAIGKIIGINGRCIEGSELSEMDEKEIQNNLSDGVNIFSRTVPKDKQKIVTALQRQGSVVAMTGDGINDAPALKKADIGVAVGSGTDVAKEASDFILLSNSFSHVVNAIEEGRGIYDNIQKTIMLLMSGNLSEVLIVVLAVIMGWDLPLTVIMILWINLVSDGAPALALAIDPYGKNIMQRPPRRSDEGIMTANQTYFVVLLALITTAYALVLFNNYAHTSLIMAQTIVFNVIIVAEIGLVFAIRLLFETPLRSNLWLWVTVLMTVLLQIIIMYTPAAKIFSVVALDITVLFRVMFIGFLVLLSGTLLSFIYRKKSTQNNT